MEVETNKETLINDIKALLLLIEKSVNLIEPRYTNRALRSVTSFRHSLTPEILAQALNLSPPSNISYFLIILYSLYLIDSILRTIGVTQPSATPITDDPKKSLPEKNAFLAYLVVLYLHDSKQYAKGLDLSKSILDAIQVANRRSMDQIAAKFYFYFAHLTELEGKSSLSRPFLLQSQRLATLRNDQESLAVLLNCILRNYIELNLYDQADKLVSKSTFPEQAVSNQVARHYYYLGRIKAIQLDYSTSHEYLQLAIRKAPQTVNAAGFLQNASKLSIIVQLLMGEIPDRSIFSQPMLSKSLIPYLHITKAVRIGDLSEFQNVVTEHIETFRRDNVFTLIHRLRHNVIKAGIRKISTSYSRISLKDICLKLQLDSEEDAEYIVAKAIRDGVIDATIDHEKGYMKSKENVDLYSTTEPQSFFNQRIKYCLDLHNASVKAMRFSTNQHKKELELSDAILEEDRKLAAEIEDGSAEYDDDVDMGEL